MDSLTANHKTIFSMTDLTIGGYSFMDFLKGTLIQDNATFKPILSFHFQDSLKVWSEKMEKYRKEQLEIKERFQLVKEKRKVLADLAGAEPKKGTSDNVPVIDVDGTDQQTPDVDLA